MGTQKNTLIFQKEAYHEIRVVKSLWFHNNFHIQILFFIWVSVTAQVSSHICRQIGQTWVNPKIIN